MLFAVLCLFCGSIGVTSATDINDNKNTLFINETNINNLDEGNNTDISTNSDVNIVKSSNGVSGANFGSVSEENIVNNTSSVSVNTTVPGNNNDSKIVNSSNKKIAAAGDVRPTNLTQKQIMVASNTVYKYVIKHKVLPNFVTIAGYKFSMPEFMYLLSVAIVYKYKKINSNVIVKYNIKNPSKPSGTNIKTKMNSKLYHKYAMNVTKFISKNNIAPNFVRTTRGMMQYQAYIFEFSKLLRWSYLKSSNLPKSISLNVKKSHKLNKVLPKYTNTDSSTNNNPNKSKTLSSLLNSKHNGESLIEFLKSSKNCQSTSLTIQSLAKNITKNCKTELEKATAIFNWVRDKISYKFYYNTKNGAVKTISAKSGNCVDKSHLLIALMRSSGIPAKYVHGTTKFNSGKTYGHVWAQVLIGDTWLVADTTSSSNSLGVVNNWDIKTAKFHGFYSAINF